MVDAVRDPLQFHAQALALRAQRQQLLASNIANADTPHYKARDFDFRQALANAQGTGSAPPALARSAPAHLPGKGPEAPVAAMLYRTERQGSVDGNTVDLDVERAAFAENAIHYEANIGFINAYLRMLQTAIQGQ
ncbi:MAG TPA: flagellar basal body rod protein FlgB [Rhodocyclaceae bacterium]|nr:MAG: flagellar basal-body rod protein FlgB [Betaproteobacteria bacterium CG2_30_68_42]PIV76897.1 MAG: flagellar basal body rod protein FlgB [Rhodocyclales bacterium CG17_big_fil_post_rev_8_21_14_2_50_68_7]PJA56981.1 MAG: flagellar basal body rod protein FlgB [Rhodocyclales bacterium CG_4_9_14_3_um_filter_68_10]HCX32938.1 flagellar basal body rod protein FlgB [Rhodocyclaceae bacterium]